MIEIVQISDCHIDDIDEVLGVNSRDNLNKIIAKISQNPANTIIISGDLSHNGSLKSYQILKTALKPILKSKQLFVLSGNHDDAQNMAQEFADNLVPNLVPKVILGRWEVVFIDSTVEQKVSGYLSNKVLKKLNSSLKNTTADYNIVVLHHPPTSMNSTWDDNLSLENPDDFWGIIDKYPKVKAILWGHAHQAAQFYRGSIKLFACPSTARQFFDEVDEKRIGFNHYKLFDNGDLAGQTQWL